MQHEEKTPEFYWDIYQIVDDQDKKTYDVILIERNTGQIKRIIYKYNI